MGAYETWCVSLASSPLLLQSVRLVLKRLAQTSRSSFQTEMCSSSTSSIPAKASIPGIPSSQTTRPVVSRPSRPYLRLKMSLLDIPRIRRGSRRHGATRVQPCRARAAQSDGLPAVWSQKSLLTTGNSDPEAEMEWFITHMIHEGLR